MHFTQETRVRGQADVCYGLMEPAENMSEEANRVAVS